MATTLSTRLPAAEQDSLSVLLPQLSMHLESASPEAVEQEIRHALKRLATDINLDAAVLAVFELEGEPHAAPRSSRRAATSKVPWPTWQGTLGSSRRRRRWSRFSSRATTARATSRRQGATPLGHRHQGDDYRVLEDAV